MSYPSPIFLLLLAALVAFTYSQDIIDCNNARNQPIPGRSSTKLTCTQLYEYAKKYASGDQSDKSLVCRPQNMGPGPGRRRKRHQQFFGPPPPFWGPPPNGQFGPPPNQFGPPPNQANMGGFGGPGVGVMGQNSCTGNCNYEGSKPMNSLYVEFPVGDKLVIATNGIPNHNYNQEATHQNPNPVCEQYTIMIIPRNPQKSSQSTATNMGPTGIARSGAFIFNHMSGERVCNFAGLSEAETFDSCNGHASPMCEYHYHKMPSNGCFNTVPNVQVEDCPLVGYMKDGFKVYGLCKSFKSCYELADKTKNTNSTYSDGRRSIVIFNGCDVKDYVYNENARSAGQCDLDDANGRIYNGQYAYFFTTNFPFIMPKYSGTTYNTKYCSLKL